MGYRCPVCGDPQADDIHLANHLAFTAMVRGGDHEAWLDESVPDWGQLDDEGLATRVVEFADSTEYPQVFEDTTAGSHTGERTQRHHASERDETTVERRIPETNTVRSNTELDQETREVIERARELTRKRRSANEESVSRSDSEGEQSRPANEDGSQSANRDDSQPETSGDNPQRRTDDDDSAQ